MKITSDILQYLAIVLLFVNVIVYSMSHHRKTATVAHKFILVYLVISLLTSVISEYLYYKKEYNLFLTHFFFISQFVLLSLFYLELLKKKQHFLIKGVLVVVLLVLSIKYILDPEIFHKYNTLEIFLTSLPIIVYSIIYLYNSLVGNTAYMYINAAVLIYLSTSTLIFFLGNYLTVLDQAAAKGIWILLKIMYIVYLSLIFLEWRFSLYKSKVLKK